MDYLVCSIITGIGATAILDLWGVVRHRLFGLAAPDYRMVARWLLHMPRGRFRHASIAAAAPMQHERLVGWCAHYVTGIVFAGLLVAVVGLDWIQRPTLLPALGTGIATVAVPFLLMQPAMGAGIAASRTPRPAAARLQSLTTHAVFGAGLYAGGWLASVLYLPIA